MGRAVLSNQPCAINSEQDIEVLYGDIVDQLVVSALQERRVNGDYRLGTIAGQARG